MDEAVTTTPRATRDHSLDLARSFSQGNALHVFRLAQRSAPTVGFDASGVAWLDRRIEASRPHLDGDLIEEFVQIMGSFYGECLIGTFGGVWALAESDEVAIWQKAQGFTYPFNAVRRQLTEPGAPSVATRYEAAVSFLAAIAA